MKISVLFLVLFFLTARNKSKKNIIQKKNETSYEYKKLALEKIGEIYYKKNCIQCHAKKGVKDQHLEYAIKYDQYEVVFLKAYLTKHNNLLKDGTKIALELKEIWNNQSSLHKFELDDKGIKTIIYYLKK